MILTYARYNAIYGDNVYIRIWYFKRECARIINKQYSLCFASDDNSYHLHDYYQQFHSQYGMTRPDSDDSLKLDLVNMPLGLLFMDIL